jgi:hypothetical protein
MEVGNGGLSCGHYLRLEFWTSLMTHCLVKPSVSMSSLNGSIERNLRSPLDSDGQHWQCVNCIWTSPSHHTPVTSTNNNKHCRACIWGQYRFVTYSLPWCVALNSLTGCSFGGGGHCGALCLQLISADDNKNSVKPAGWQTLYLFAGRHNGKNMCDLFLMEDRPAKVVVCITRKVFLL